MKIAVIGVGKMGSWFARELSKSNTVAVYDKDTEKMSLKEKITHLETLSDIFSFEPELLINAVPLQQTIEVFKEAFPSLPPSCILVDIATIKGNLLKYYQSCNCAYASLHPMFGPRFADFENLKKETVVIMEESDKRAKKFFRNFFESYGIKIIECSFDEHDQLMALSLALPFFSSLVFSACITRDCVPGTTFRRHRETAQKLLEEDDSLLAEVLFNPFSLNELEKMRSCLDFLEFIVQKKNYEDAREFFCVLRKKFTSSDEVIP